MRKVELMARASRSKKARGRRRWFKNVGDPIELARQGIANPNDGPNLAAGFGKVARVKV